MAETDALLATLLNSSIESARAMDAAAAAAASDRAKVHTAHSRDRHATRDDAAPRTQTASVAAHSCTSLP